MPFIDLLFPPLCVGCRRELRADALCQNCLALLPGRHSQRCPHCKQRLPFGHLPLRCQKALGIERLFTAGPYAHPLLRAAIDAFKYNAIRDLAKPLTLLLARSLREALSDIDAAMLIPVPLHEKRLRERGFNQSALLARLVAQELGIGEDETILMRQHATKQQARLSPEEREENMTDAFFAAPSPLLRSHTVILIDDVATTGATMREAARALRRAGAKEVWAASVAQG